MMKLYESNFAEIIDDFPAGFGELAFAASCQLKTEPLGDPVRFNVQKLVEMIGKIIDDARQNPPTFFPFRPSALGVICDTMMDARGEVRSNPHLFATIEEVLADSLERASKIKLQLESALDIRLVEEELDKLRIFCLLLSRNITIHSGPVKRY